MKPELARRIAFTLGALLVYRLGTYIPLPGIAPNIWEQVFRSQAGGILGPLNMLAGGGIHRIAILSLGILPYLSAAILIQLVSMVSSKLSALSRRGEAGRRKIARYTIALAIFLAGFQAFGIASGLQGIPNYVNEPSGFFVISSTATLMGGTIFLIWLSEQITARGIGNGLALILFVDIVAGLPQTFASVLVLARQGALSDNQIALFAVLPVAVTGLVVFVELARRRVPVEYVARNLGGRVLPAQSSHLSFKLNGAGFLPSFVAPWLYLLPLSIVGIALGRHSPLLAPAFDQLAIGHLGHMIVGSIAIVIVTFFYTASLVDPDHAADSIVKYGGVIPGIFPGEPTAEYVDRVVSRTTCIGAVYLAAVFLVPELLLTYGQAPFYLGGASVLIVVCTVLDIETQVRGPIAHRAGGRNV